MMEKPEVVVVLMRDGRQYYRTEVPREALGRLATAGIVDLDQDQDQDEDDGATEAE